MEIVKAIVLGVIQGLTEFVPVSSTAHLLIAQRILGIPSGEATFAFLVIVQLGTLLSLLIYYWRDVYAIATAMVNVRALKTSSEGRLGWYILLATVPALIGGYLLRDAVEMLFRTPLLEAAIRLFLAAILLALAERFSQKNRSLDSVTWLDALVIGLFQVVAVFPGASRSGATISGGMLRGFERSAAARFAFLMSIPVMAAAGGYELLNVLGAADLNNLLPALVIGFLAAALVGWLAIHWLIRFLGRHSLYGFVLYCAGVGVCVGVFWASTGGSVQLP